MRCGLAPMARKIPISFCFCTTDTTSTLAMPTATITVTKKRIRLLDMLWLFKADSSCALVCIQLSTVRPVCACSWRAVASAANRFSTRRSSCVMPPGRSNRVCANLMLVNTQRRFRSRLPISKMPATLTRSLRPSTVTRRSLSPTVMPRSLASSLPMTTLVPLTSNRPWRRYLAMRTMRW